MKVTKPTCAFACPDFGCPPGSGLIHCLSSEGYKQWVSECVK